MISDSNMLSNDPASSSRNLRMMAIVWDTAPLPSPSPASPGPRSRQGLLQVRRQWVFQFDQNPTDRMVERETPRMKERTGEAEARGIVPTSAVPAIAEDGMADRCEMDADLMGPARSWAGLDQRHVAQQLTHPNIGGGLSPGPRPDLDPG